MDNTPTFIYYDPDTASWSNQTYTLDELQYMPEITEQTYLCTADGKKRMTYAEARNYTPPEKKAIYHYEVIEHTKYSLGGDLDISGFKKKLNECARKGYRLVGICAPTTQQTEQLKAIQGALTGSSGSPSVSLNGIVAIMEARLS